MESKRVFFMAQISISQTQMETQQRSFEKKTQAFQNHRGANEHGLKKNINVSI